MMKIEDQKQFDLVRRFLHRVWNDVENEYFGEEIEDYLDTLEDALLAYNGIKVI